MGEILFYKGLREMRKNRGFTQQQLADLAGTNIVTISQYETNKYRPSLEKVYEFSKVLNCNVIDLLCLERDKSFSNHASNSADLINSWVRENQKLTFHVLRTIDSFFAVSSDD
ncbi:helix-turn-helix transcriptional regulator [Reichenbachiella sp.]|uniref:helix-turn-helix transcriptional regulator n=1 Tax=Reichenbachiella sp. TaxID=2184521 RepID=UPI00329886D3